MCIASCLASIKEAGCSRSIRLLLMHKEVFLLFGCRSIGIQGCRDWQTADSFSCEGPRKPVGFKPEQLPVTQGSDQASDQYAEAGNVEKVVTHFLKNGVQPNQIGVITPYEGQRAHVLAVMLRSGPMRPGLYEQVEHF